MENISGKIIAFIASLLVGFIIVVNMKLSSLPVNKQLSATEYKEAIDERNRLFKELELLEKENNETNEKINSYTSVEQIDEKVISDMKEQVNYYGMLTGFAPVKGPGVVIKIKDGDIDVKNESAYETAKKIFHDNDAAMVLNDIKLAGGEVFALNDHRIIPSTSLECNWAFIGFDNDTITPSPFYYYVIGNPEQLELLLTKDGSYLNKLRLRGLKVELEVKEEIELPPSNQSFEPQFMKQVKIK